MSSGQQSSAVQRPARSRRLPASLQEYDAGDDGNASLSEAEFMSMLNGGAFGDSVPVGSAPSGQNPVPAVPPASSGPPAAVAAAADPNAVDRPADGKVDNSKMPEQSAQAGGGNNAPPPPPPPPQQQNGNNAAAVPPGVARAMFRMFNTLSGQIPSAISYLRPFRDRMDDADAVAGGDMDRKYDRRPSLLESIADRLGGEPDRKQQSVAVPVSAVVPPPALSVPPLLGGLSQPTHVPDPKREAEHIAHSVDAYLLDKVSPLSDGMEMQLRRLAGIHLADEMEDWEVCEQIQFTPTSKSLLPRMEVDRVVKSAVQRKRLMTSVGKSSSSSSGVRAGGNNNWKHRNRNPSAPSNPQSQSQSSAAPAAKSASAPPKNSNPAVRQP